MPTNTEPAAIPGKGKGRAQDFTERTPLLASGSSTSIPHAEGSTPPPLRRLGYRLFRVFLITLLICICALAVLILVAWKFSSRASDMSPQDILDKALVVQGPDRVDVLNVSLSEGVWVNVQGRIGLDAGAIVGVDSDPHDGVMDKIWKYFGRLGVENMNSVSVWTSTATISSRSDSSVILASIDLPPMEIPLTVNPPTETTWLQAISVPVLVRPTTNASDLFHFALESWRNGYVAVKTEVPTVEVRGGKLTGTSWRNILHRQLYDVRTAFSLKFPPIPGLPHPGRNAPIPSFEDIVTLRSFQFLNDAQKLTIQAIATVIDPAPSTFSFTAPPLLFIISLVSNSSVTPIASIETDPFDLTHPNITLSMSGHVLSLSSDAFPALSTFVTSYLSGRSNPISISTPLISDMTFETIFPAPSPKPKILRNVTIHDMKVKPGNTFLASGTVLAHVVLPRGMNLDLSVKHVLPDVLVPEDWLDSRCVAIEPIEGEGSTFAVSAKLVDVPLEVLPGRQKEFSNFVSKLIFGNSAIAGILGSAAIKVTVPEPTDGLELDGLPFRGSVKLGKGSFLR
ncbi:hypothetical protein BDP27DRAFT_1341002 [Rhodocollybia butyracea]|uniref:Uncharacterized protein n=1 Tax=Rhodocollybia butyracea TaxID=206335 RepID=A0A9P5PA64_9AGAR|nr:hypothetical protein BDP27DRAFT_1341002 [Rhodocollybia butyracea]